MLFSSMLAPKLFAASIAPWYGQSASLPWFPRVRDTPLLPSTLAAIIGAIQHSAWGLPAAWNSSNTRETSASTDISAPSYPKVERFLAAPTPPAWSAVSSVRGLGAALAILADSVRTFLV